MWKYFRQVAKILRDRGGHFRTAKSEICIQVLRAVCARPVAGEKGTKEGPKEGTSRLEELKTVREIIRELSAQMSCTVCSTQHTKTD